MSLYGRLQAQLPPEQQAIRARCWHPSNTFVEFTPAVIEQSIVQRFEQQVHQYPQRLALKTRHHTFTYTAVNEAANRIAHALLPLCNRGQQPVALLFATGAPFVIAALGVLKAGNIVVALESTFPRARLTYVLKQSEAAVLVTDTANLPFARDLAALPTLNIDTLDTHLPISNPGLYAAPDALTSIGYTSGSTGQPKGIVWNHRGLLRAVMRHTNTMRLCLHDRLVMFRATLRGALYALLNGAAFYPVDLRQEEPLGLADWLMQEHITIYRAAVSAFRGFAGTLVGTESFPDLRLICLFGEPIYHTEVDLYRRHFAAHSILVGSLGCNEFDDYAYFFVDQDTPLTAGVVPGGYASADAEVLLLDDDGHAVALDQVGEIALRSRYNAVGYWQRPDLTAAAFLPDPTGGEARVYRTGDLGRRRPDGCLFHMGRKDFQVKIRGYRVDVSEVETALLALAGVQEAVVVGREDTPGDVRLVAYLVPTEAHTLNASDMRRTLAETLPEYMVPSTFVMLKTLPHTATGKVDRRALPAPHRTRPVLNTPFRTPRTPVEAQLARIWAEVLGLEEVGVHDNFLDVGGHSLLATQVVSRVLAQLHVRVPLRTLLEAPTIADMAAVIVQSQASTLEQEELTRLLMEVEALSEEEARVLLKTPPA
jgi:amino acid adenylation domain-containing protein